MATEIASTENKANRPKSKFSSKVFPAKTAKEEEISILQDDNQEVSCMQSIA